MVFQRIHLRTYLSDGVIGLRNAFSEVCRLSCPAGPAGWRPTFCDGKTAQRWSWREDVIHRLSSGLKYMPLKTIGDTRYIFLKFCGLKNILSFNSDD